MNPCEKHINVKADGYCPVCLVDKIHRLTKALEVAEEAIKKMIGDIRIPLNQRFAGFRYHPWDVGIEALAKIKEIKDG